MFKRSLSLASFGASLSLISGLLQAACSSGAREVTSDSDGRETFAGELRLFVIPPAGALDWSSPNTLARTSAVSKMWGEIDKHRGKYEAAHAIGHVHLALECGDIRIPITGQTGGGSEVAGALDGLGSMFRTYPGRLDDSDAAEADVAKRFASGDLRVIAFKVRRDTCKHLAGFIEEYTRRGAEKNYGGQFRPRRFEGAGCTAFGTSFIEVGGLLPRSQFTPAWARTMNVGVARLSDVLGAGSYAYGSNLATFGATPVAWPKGAPIAVQTDPLLLGGETLGAWTGPEDATANVGAPTQPNEVPLTLYDPELMVAFVDQVWESGGGPALGKSWEASVEGNTRVVTTDATGATHLPYEDGKDDLAQD